MNSVFEAFAPLIILIIIAGFMSIREELFETIKYRKAKVIVNGDNNDIKAITKTVTETTTSVADNNSKQEIDDLKKEVAMLQAKLKELEPDEY